MPCKILAAEMLLILSRLELTDQNQAVPQGDLIRFM